MLLDHAIRYFVSEKSKISHKNVLHNKILRTSEGISYSCIISLALLIATSFNAPQHKI